MAETDDGRPAPGAGGNKDVEITASVLSTALIESSDYAVDMVEDYQGFSQMAGEWDNLLANSRQDHVFLSFCWLDAWLRTWREYQDSVRILTVRSRENGALVGVLPLYEEKMGVLGGRWAFIGSGRVGSDYLEAVVHKDVEEQVQVGLVKSLLRLSGERWQLLELSNVPADSRFLSIITNMSRQFDDHYYWGPAAVCPVISIGEDGYDGVLERGEPAYIKQAVRKRKRLEREDGFQFGLWTEPAMVGDALSIYERLHVKRFGSRSEAVGDETRNLFNRNAMDALAQAGMWRFYWLKLGGQVAAVIWGFEANGKFYYYQTGFEPALGNKSAGTVLLLLALEECAARGVRQFDLLHGNESYKFAFADKGNYLDGARIYHHGLAGMFAIGVREGRRTAGRVVHRVRALSLEGGPDGESGGG